MAINITYTQNNFFNIGDAFDKGILNAFRYQGHLYIVIRKANSKNVKIETEFDSIAALNIKSCTIRGIGRSEFVELVNLDIDVTIVV